MAEHHFEQEEVERIKAWWQRYGNLASLILIMVLLGIAAVRAWAWYQDKQAREAAEIYDRAVMAANKADLALLKQESGSLFEQYPKTTYAPLAAMLSAKQHAQASDLKTAGTLLQSVIDRQNNEGFQVIARLRLATVLLDEGKAEEALKVLDAVNISQGGALEAFALAHLDRKGDVLMALGRTDEALKSWDEAIVKASEEPAWKQLIQIKRDHAATSSRSSS